MTWRGLWQRRWLSLIVLVVALVPVTAAALGPIYRSAAETAILRDTLNAAPVEGTGWHYTATEDPTLSAVAARAPFLRPPVKGMELLSPRVGDKRRFPLMWQEGQCAHVTILRGRCPTAAREVMASAASGLDLGLEVRLTMIVRSAGDQRAVPLKVVGLYEAADDPFWFGRALFQGNEARAEPLFTDARTRMDTFVLGAFGGSADKWIDYATVTVDTARLLGSDLPALRAVHAQTAALARERGGTLNGGFKDTLATMVGQVDALSVPLVLVIAQLTALGWLLLFQTVADLVRARGPEIALARLRGQSRLQVWRFGLAEPVVVLAAALVAGVALAGYCGRLLAPAGVPVPVTPLAVLTGAGAVLGGVAAAAVAAHHTAVRPVTEQWRRTPRSSARGWVLDAVVLALAGLGLVELLAAGVITETSGRHVAALAVPGLLALAVALLAARLLPLLARVLFRVTRRRGGLGAFLAIRQVARGAVTVGSVVVVATAVGVATFAAVAWTVTSANFREVARTHTGAATVVDVAPVDVRELRRAVEAADSSGRRAAPVIRVPGRPSMIASDPVRLAHVGYWREGLAAATSRLGVTGAPRLWVTGSRLRVTTVHGKPPKDWQIRIFAVFRVPGTDKGGQIPLGPLRAGPDEVYSWNLPPGCRIARCELRGFRADVFYNTSVTPEEQAVPYTITGIEVLSGGQWQRLNASLTEPGAWSGGLVTASGLGLPVRLSTAAFVRPATYPDALPAIANGLLDGGLKLPGLDGLYAAGAAPVATGSAVPGMNELGVLVDLELADRVAYSVGARASYEVWVTSPDLVSALRTEGLTVLRVRDAGLLERQFTTTGPGSAVALLAVSAAFAAALALGRAVLALYAASRRRGYELAALSAAGARGWALRVSLLLEQALTLGTGVLGGVLAGVLAARAALPRIPSFAEQPVTPPLVYTVPTEPVLVVGGVALVAGLVAALVLSEVLIRGITIDRLREAPS